MEKGYFITGTDTNAGKTWATIALMRYFKQQGKSVAGMKPVASGCSFPCAAWECQDGQLKNEDALLIQENASIQIDYDLINPYAYELPVSPHIAGINNPVKLANIVERFYSGPHCPDNLSSSLRECCLCYSWLALSQFFLINCYYCAAGILIFQCACCGGMWSKGELVWVSLW